MCLVNEILPLSIQGNSRIAVKQHLHPRQAFWGFSPIASRLICKLPLGANQGLQVTGWSRLHAMLPRARQVQNPQNQPELKTSFWRVLQIHCWFHAACRAKVGISLTQRRTLGAAFPSVKHGLGRIRCLNASQEREERERQPQMMERERRERERKIERQPQMMERERIERERERQPQMMESER